MRNILLSFLMLATCRPIFSQAFSFGAAYSYCYAPQWDKAIQTYNFSRPFLENKQPLIQHGFAITTSWFGSSTGNFHHGFSLGYNMYRSSVENTNLNNLLVAHLVTPGYLLHFAPSENENGYYGNFSISAVLGGVFRKIDGEAYLSDGSRVKGLGIGGQLHCEIGYEFALAGKISFAPNFALGYTPYYYSPSTEAVINQTQNLSGKTSTGIFQIEAGIRFHINRSE